MEEEKTRQGLAKIQLDMEEKNNKQIKIIKDRQEQIKTKLDAFPEKKLKSETEKEQDTQYYLNKFVGRLYRSISMV